MMKATIKHLSPTMRLLKFSKLASPSWVNEGQGWTPDLAVEAASLMGVSAKQVSESSTNIMFRVQPPRVGKLKTKELVQGMEVVCDGEQAVG